MDAARRVRGRPANRTLAHSTARSAITAAIAPQRVTMKIAETTATGSGYDPSDDRPGLQKSPARTFPDAIADQREEDEPTDGPRDTSARRWFST
jgi:hypothetical protein